MNRVQFLEQLERLLYDISETERSEALDYYSSYFDDAGPENEAQVIRELGSPGKVAAIIKADLKEGNDGYASYTELGYEDSRNQEKTQVPDKFAGVAKPQGSSSSEDKGFREESRRSGTNSTKGTYSYGNNPSGERKYEDHGSRDFTGRRASRGRSGGRGNNAPGILFLILMIFLAPILAKAAGGVLKIVVTILLLPFLVTFGLLAAVCGLLAGGVGMIAGGIALCFSYLGGGFLTIGIGSLILAVGLVLLVLLVGAQSRMLPWFLRKTTEGIHLLLNKIRSRKDGGNI